MNPSVKIAGIDRPEEMLRAASSRNRDAMQTGRVELRVGSVTDLPYVASHFDKAFSINCIYFWENPVQGLKELNRVLKPGGVLAITVRDGNRYQVFRPKKLANMLAQAEFVNVRVLNNGISAHPLNCALGLKQASP